MTMEPDRLTMLIFKDPDGCQLVKFQILFLLTILYFTNNQEDYR